MYVRPGKMARMTVEKRHYHFFEDFEKMARFGAEKGMTFLRC
jgi:hypothetical protein